MTTPRRRCVRPWSDTFSRRTLVNTDACRSIVLTRVFCSVGGNCQSVQLATRSCMRERVVLVVPSSVEPRSYAYKATPTWTSGCGLNRMMSQMIAATSRLSTAANSAAPWSISTNVRHRMASRILMPVCFRPDRVLNIMAGITRSMYSKYLVGGRHGASRDTRQERNGRGESRRAWIPVEHPARCTPLVPHMRNIEIPACQNRFSAAC